jgi:hypothetical protein
MRRLLLVPVFGVAALVLTAPVQAQTRGWAGDGRAYSAPSQQSFYDSGRVAYDNGFREGLKQGEKDGRKQDQFRYQDEKRSSAPTRATTVSSDRSIDIDSRFAPATPLDIRTRISDTRPTTGTVDTVATAMVALFPAATQVAATAIRMDLRPTEGRSIRRLQVHTVVTVVVTTMRPFRMA